MNGLIILLCLLLAHQADAQSRNKSTRAKKKVVHLKPLPAAERYRKIDVGWIHWERAREMAGHFTYKGRRGHLVTITSAEENRIVSALGDLDGYALGGYQVMDKYGERWRWVTTEPWIYQNWALGEPNQGGGKEDYLTGFPDGKWNDGEMVKGFVVEFE